jgi:murein DD-endopeptidase MepM/ murein hydrolase activator NlpD
MRRRVLIALVLSVVALWSVSALAYHADPRALASPVRGVRAASVRSTFGARRSGGRRHQGADIFAPRGTPVVSAHDGLVVHVGTNPLGGIVVHTLGRRGVLCYYAHLDRVAPGVHAGLPVSEGTVLGTVGNTGNARTTPPHLHFEARPLAWGLRAVDPVRLLGGRVGDGRARAGIHRRFR